MRTCEVERCDDDRCTGDCLTRFSLWQKIIRDHPKLTYDIGRLEFDHLKIFKVLQKSKENEKLA